MEILYSDKDIAVVVKPVGALSEESGNKTSVPLLIKEALGVKDVFSVHRLDKNVGGVMVYALSSRASSALIRDVAERKIIKEYACLIYGAPENPSGEMTDLLFHDSTKNKTYIAKSMRKGVRDARLEYKTIAVKDGISLMKIRLHTGRTHQIRVQFASRALPLIGDGRYGSRDNQDKPCLFSYHLSFRHPVSRKMLNFVKIPDFSALGFSEDVCKELENFRFESDKNNSEDKK